MTIQLAFMTGVALTFALSWWSQRRRADRLEQDVEWERKVAAAIAVQRDDARQELREARITFNRRLFGVKR